METQKTNFKKIVKKFNSKTIGVFGDLIADVYIYGITERISREAPVVVVRKTGETIVAGGAGNVAKNISGLGGKVKLITATGKDKTAHQLVDLFKKDKKIEPIILQSPSIRTVTKTRILAGAINTRLQHIARVDDYNTKNIPKTIEERLIDTIIRLDPYIDGWILSDYGYHIITNTIIELFQDIARRKPVLADSRFNLKAFKNLTIIKPNEPEALDTAGLSPSSPIKTVAKKLKELLAPEAVIITLGKKGMFVYKDEKHNKLAPAVGPEDIVDLTGAGDTAAAAIMLSVASGADYYQAATIANCAASITVMKQGTAICLQKELLGRIDEYIPD